MNAMSKIKFLKSSRSLSTSLCASALLFFAAPDAMAQEEEARRDVERLQVTGSHIKRIDVEGPSPIQIIDRDMLDETGYNSVSDVLRDITASSFGGGRETSGTNSAGVATVSLRGLGADRTLVLLDGKRLPADPITGAVDLNLVPMAAVERIDVLKDGASATYGSDALGGVVNIITRQDFVGTEVTLRTSANRRSGGERTDVSVVNSSAGPRGQVLTVFNYRNNNKVKSKDRPWSDDGLSVFATPANATPVTGGNFGDLTRSQNCPSDSINSDGHCEYKFSDFMDEVPDLEQMSMMSKFTYDITPDITAYMRLIANRNEVDWQFAPNAAFYEVFRNENNSGRTGLVIDDTRFDSLVNSGDFPGTFNNGDSLLVRDRLTALGPRVQEGTTNSFNVQTGLKGYLFDTWDWDVSYDYNKLKRVNMSKEGYAQLGPLGELLGTGSDQYDPFEIKPTDADVLAEGGVLYQPWNESEAVNHYVNALMSGELFYLANRPVSAAFGASLLNEEYYNQVDSFSENGQVLGSAGSSGGGSRTVVSSFAELAMNPLESLEIQLAGRFDSYNDFGTTFNPKFGFRFQANPNLMVRGSVGTGFKAPTLVELYLAQSDGNPFFKDEFGCQEAGGTACQAQQYNVRQGGNPDLEEETSLSYNVGALYQLTQSTSLGLDFWAVELDDAVGIDLEKITLAEARGLDIESRGITTIRDSQGRLIRMEAVNQNLSSRTLRGIDAKFAHSHMTSFGRFSFGLEHSHLFGYKLESFPGLGEEDILGENGLPSWRNTATLAYVPSFLPRGSFHLIAKTIGGHEKDDAEQGDLDRYTEFDFQFNYNTTWNGTLTVGVINLFGSTPPLDDTTPNDQLNDSLYNPFGQSAYVQYSQSF